MNLKHLSDEQVHDRTVALVAQEKNTTLAILHHLREVERRMIYAKRAYASLFEYCQVALGYDGAAAQRRIASMRLLKELPELEEKVHSGELNFSLMAQAQTFFRKERIRSHEEKREIVAAIAGKSARNAQKELLKRAEVPEIHRPERVTPVSDVHSELRCLVDEELLKQLEELKALLAHSHPRASLGDLIKVAVSEAVEKRKPNAKTKTLSTSEGVMRQKKLSVNKIKQIVFRRDGGCCTYTHQGRRCNSKYALEYDHIVPVALGGETTAENLRLRCRKHNQWEALRVFGAKKMAEHIPSLGLSRKEAPQSSEI